MLTVASHRGLQGLLKLQEEWLCLLDRRQWHPFERPEIFRALLESGLVEDADMLFHAVGDGKHLLAVFPLVESRRNRLRALGGCWRAPVHDHLPFATPCMAAGADAVALVAALGSHLARQFASGPAVVLLDFLEPGAGSPSEPLRPHASYSREFAISEIHYGSTPAEVALAQPPALRKSLARARRRLEATGDFHFARHDPACWEDALADFLRLEDSGWKHEAGTSISPDEQLSRFYWSLARHCQAAGYLSISRLVVGGKAAAAQFSLAGSDKLYVLKSGYDEAQSAFSPGNSLRLEVLLDGVRSGVRPTLNLVGTPHWGDQWHPRPTRLSAYAFTLPQWRGRLLRPLLAALQWGKPARRRWRGVAQGAHNP